VLSTLTRPFTFARAARGMLQSTRVSVGMGATLLIFASIAASLAYVWAFSPLALAPDEAHYWDWSLRLDWSYYSKGPLVAWLIRGSCEVFGSLSVALTGDLAAAVRLPAAFFHVALLAGWYALAAGVFRSPRLGLAVVACAVALPLVRAGAVLMTIDPPFLAFWCWALICVWKGLESGHSRWWAAAGLCAALGTLAKYTMALFPAAVVAYLLFHRRSEFRKPGVWLLLAGAALGWLPVLVWNAQHDWVSFRHVFGQVGGPGGRGIRWDGAASFLGGQFGMLFGFWLVAFLAAGWCFRPARETDPAVRLLWWVSVPVWCLFACASFVKPGQPNWPAPAYVGGFVLAVAWARGQWWGSRSRSVRWGVGLSAAAGLIVAGGLHFPQLMRPVLALFVPAPSEKSPLPVRSIDVTARLTGWKELAAEVDALRDRLRSETGTEPIVAGTHWTLPGSLRFYCAGHPDVFSIGIPNRSDRHSQYDLWRPNPVDDAQAFRGKTFVIVGDLGSPVLAAFERVELPRWVVHPATGSPVARWSVWVCHGFRGFDRADKTGTGEY
jgi:hypothetical protein